MLMTVMVFGGGSPGDLAERIRSGDVAIDLYRPVGLLGWYVAADLGRAAYHLVTRGVAPTLVGALLLNRNWPDDAAAWLGFAISVVLAVLVSFGLRFLVACTAFWLLDATGPAMIALTLAVFFSGLTVPLVIFPGRLKEVALALPWASYLQAPADIWLGKRTGFEVVEALGLQALWAAVLLAVGAAVLGLATRKVVVQGG
jgi:ABC-2 type transport system permease protein